VKFVRSRANPLYRTFLRLKDSLRERRRSNSTLLDGAQLIATHLGHRGRILALAVSEDALGSAQVEGLVTGIGGVEPVVFPAALFRDISSVTTPSGVVAVVPIPQAPRLSPEVECAVLLEGIQDPGNLGAILRTAAAAGVRHALLSAGCADAWSPRVLRAAMGAHALLTIAERTDLVSYARAYAGQVVACDAASAKSIYEIDLTVPAVFAFGNEGAGLSPALKAEADIAAAIPMSRGVESLNVGAAVAVCLFERARQIRARALR